MRAPKNSGKNSGTPRLGSAPLDDIDDIRKLFDGMSSAQRLSVARMLFDELLAAESRKAPA